MFKVDVDSLDAYFNFDPLRKGELKQLDSLIREQAPNLSRYFHKGTPTGQPGMRFKLIGYGKTLQPARNGQRIEWPAIGVALQKNYISVYLVGRIDGVPVLDRYKQDLGAARTGDNNFSFVNVTDINNAVLVALLQDCSMLYAAS